MGYKEKFKEKMNDRTYEEHLKKNYIKRRENSEAKANAYSYFLAAVCVIVAVVFFVFGEFWLGLLFVGMGGLLVLLVYLTKEDDGKENSRKERKKK